MAACHDRRNHVQVAAAAISGDVPAWDDEIEALFERGAELPEAARAALCGVLESVMAEGSLDPRQSRVAIALRDTLADEALLSRAA